MLDTERELAKLGVPVKTRHNEVAPNQYEIAPVFENSNVGSDHQQLTMQVMQNVARRYGLVCLLHEKPFAGVNGSGKHNNWSMGTDTGKNLLEPGDTPHENLEFLFFCAAVIQAVNKHQGLLRASIASAGQDHRLGANEAPPAIISIFLGAGAREGVRGDRARRGGRVDAGVVPRPRHAGAAAAADARRRPQPHEPVRLHRQQVRVPRAGIEHVAVAAQHGAEHDRRRGDRLRWPTSSRSALRSGADLEAALPPILQRSYAANKQIIFGGDNYSEDWHAEAERRGLLNLTRDARRAALPGRRRHESLFSKYGVLSGASSSRATRCSSSSTSPSSTSRPRRRRRSRGRCCCPRPRATSRCCSSAGLPELVSELEGLVGAVRRARSRRLEAANLAENQPHDDLLEHGRYMREPGHPGDGGRPRGGRPAREGRGRRPLAAAEVLGDPLHQVAGAETP